MFKILKKYDCLLFSFELDENIMSSGLSVRMPNYEATVSKLLALHRLDTAILNLS